MSPESIRPPVIKPDSQVASSEESWSAEQRESFRQLVEFLSMQFSALPGSLSLAIEGKVPAFTLEYVHRTMRSLDKEIQKKLISWGMRSRFIPTLFQTLAQKIDQLYNEKAPRSKVRQEIDASANEITTELFNFIRERRGQPVD